MKVTHNFGHWLKVVFIRMLYFLILGPIGVYTVFFGFLLSTDIFQQVLSESVIDEISSVFAFLPFSRNIGEFVMSQLGRWYSSAVSWWALAVGAPLMMIGLSVILINFFNLYYSLFSRDYNQDHCSDCNVTSIDEI
jgi:hypothetical protein